MAFAVLATPIANAAIAALRGRVRTSFERKRNELVAQGCRTAGYRLTGEGVDHICVAHLADDYRLVSVFLDKSRIAVVLVGRHTGGLGDVYRTLYELLELDVPAEPRTRPPCCDEPNDPPVDPELIRRFLAGSKQLLDRAEGQRRRTKR